MASARDLHQRSDTTNTHTGVLARHADTGHHGWTPVADTPSDLFGLYSEPAVTHLALVSADGRSAPFVSYCVSRRGEESGAGALPRAGSLADLGCDILRRCLGLPTAAATDGPSQWTLRAWLERLLEHAADPTLGPLDWSTAASMHPAAATTATPDELALDAVTVDETLPWPMLHAGAASGRLVVPGLSTAEAAWMDHPFFARWLLAGHREVDELLDDLHLFLAPQVASAVELTASMIRRLGFERHESGVT